MKRRTFCLILCIILCLSCIPTGALAGSAFNAGTHVEEIPAEEPQRFENAGSGQTDPRPAAVPSSCIAAVDTLGSFATLSEAVDAISSSGGAGTIHLLSDYVLPETLTIPGALQVTITDDGHGYTVSESSSSSNYRNGMIHVTEDASLTLSGSITLLLAGTPDLRGFGPVVSCEGTFTMMSGTMNGDGLFLNAGTGLVSVRGAKATFTMNGGSIRNVRFKGSGGGVFVSDGGSFTMNDGEITGIDSEKNSQAGAVLVFAHGTPQKPGDAFFTMNGGEIHGNKGYRGAGVYLVGEKYTNCAKMTMNGGKIIDNTAKSIQNGERFFQSAGAGVYLEFNAGLTMNGGMISRNTVYGGMGGGVATACGYETAPAGWTIENYSRYYPAAFLMNGGEISGNAAYMGDGHNGCGGGIYIASNCVELRGGIIADNFAEKQGGGIYIGSNPYVLRLFDVVITKNEAELLGGGIWLCPTGEAEIFTNHGAGIFENTSRGSGDDVVSVKKPEAGHMLTLSERMLGGGRVTWVEDGGLDCTEEFGFPNDSVPRCGSGSIEADGITGSNAPYALKAVLGNDARALAIASAKLLITGNSSPRGGGIGCNGGIIMGEQSDWRLSVTKSWQNGSGSAESAEYLSAVTPVTVSLMAGDYVLDSVELNEENGWQAEFTGLPDPRTISDEYAFHVSEKTIPANFTAAYSAPTVDTDSNAIGITVINTYYANPETGDNSPVLFVVMLFAFGMAARTGIVICRRKNKYTDG